MQESEEQAAERRASVGLPTDLVDLQPFLGDIGVSAPTVAQWAVRGEFPRVLYTAQGKYRVSRAALTDWFSARWIRRDQAASGAIRKDLGEDAPAHPQTGQRSA